MSSILELIKNNKLKAAQAVIQEQLDNRVQRILVEAKKMLAAEIDMNEAKFKIVRARVRAGKVLRRHKVASGDGWTIRNGKVTKMQPRERLNRRRSQRKGARKRKAKSAKRKLSTAKAMRKRRGIGLK